jgi:hypothetical protein
MKDRSGATMVEQICNPVHTSVIRELFPVSPVGVDVWGIIEVKESQTGRFAIKYRDLASKYVLLYNHLNSTFHIIKTKRLAEIMLDECCQPRGKYGRTIRKAQIDALSCFSSKRKCEVVEFAERIRKHYVDKGFTIPRDEKI